MMRILSPFLIALVLVAPRPMSAQGVDYEIRGRVVVPQTAANEHAGIEFNCRDPAAWLSMWSIRIATGGFSSTTSKDPTSITSTSIWKGTLPFGNA